jgi:hypothetical protein
MNDRRDHATRARSRMASNEKVEIWDRWKQGQSLSDIGRALDRIPGAVFHIVAARGGVPPPARFRSPLALTGTEREEISRGLATGVSFRQTFSARCSCEHVWLSVTQRFARSWTLTGRRPSRVRRAPLTILRHRPPPVRPEPAPQRGAARRQASSRTATGRAMHEAPHR